MDRGAWWATVYGWQESVCCSPWGHRVGHDLATEQKHHVCYSVPELSTRCSRSVVPFFHE